MTVRVGMQPSALNRDRSVNKFTEQAQQSYCFSSLYVFLLPGKTVSGQIVLPLHVHVLTLFVSQFQTKFIDGPGFEVARPQIGFGFTSKGRGGTPKHA